MSTLREIIKENLLLEKRISQISANIEVTFGFDVDRTHHAYIRKTRSDIEGYDEREISNSEITYIIQLAKYRISEKIVSGEINNGIPFVIKSPEKSIAMSIVPSREFDMYWKLYVTTVFRESYSNPFRVSKGQIVVKV